MRDNLKRVNIVLTKEQIPRFREAAKRCHGSVSQFLRMAAENELERGRNGGGTAEIDVALRPLVDRLENLEKAVERIENKVVKNEKGIDFLVDMYGGRIEKVARDVKRLFEERGGELSVPDMGDFLPYGQDELIKAVEKLEDDDFMLVRVEHEKGITKWRLRGEAGGK